MADQTQRLEIATVRAEVGSNIVYRFANDAEAAGPIPTESGDIQNLKRIILGIQTDAADKISISTTIYPTVESGLAATPDQSIFLVQSSDEDEIYTVWKNESGTAVNTGKTALSATAIQTALDASSEAAQAAESAADVATSRTARYLEPSETPPVTRDDGLALEIGDVWFNTTDQTEYRYTVEGWRPNESQQAIADIANPDDPEKGAALVGWDGEKISVQLAQSKKLSGYQELRDYRGAADRVIIRTKKYAGTFLKRAKILGDMDDGGIKLVSSDGQIVWEREFTGPVQACWFGPMGAGVDSALAVNAAVNSIVAKSPASLFGSGGEVEVGNGRFNIKTPVISKFGVTLKGGGTDLYTSCFSLDPDFVGEAAIVLRSDSYASYTNGHLKNIAVSCNNVAGAGGVLFAGAYNNSSIQDCLVTGVNGASIGLEVRPMTTEESPTAITACESLLLKDLYILHHDTPGAVTQPTIKLTRCQESTMLNVKAFSGRNNLGSVPTSQSAILLNDCRGITSIGGAVVGSRYGLTIEAVTKDISGFSIINPTYENVSDQGLRVIGRNGFTVTGVDQGVPRYEAPNPSFGFYSENCRNSSVHTGVRGWSLGVGSVGMEIRDFGSGPTAADGSARYSRHVPPNSSNNRNLLDSSAGQEIHAPSTPGHRYTAGSRSNYWQLHWVASDAVDSGFRLINSSNRAAWHAGDNGAEVTLGFFNKPPIIRPTVSGVRGTAAMDALLLKALSDLGLINDQTTAP